MSLSDDDRARLLVLADSMLERGAPSGELLQLELLEQTTGLTEPTAMYRWLALATQGNHTFTFDGRLSLEAPGLSRWAPMWERLAALPATALATHFPEDFGSATFLAPDAHRDDVVIVQPGPPLVALVVQATGIWAASGLVAATLRAAIGGLLRQPGTWGDEPVRLLEPLLAADRVLEEYWKTATFPTDAQGTRLAELLQPTIGASARHPIRGPGSASVIAASIQDGEMWLVHIGRNRAYLHSNDGLRQLTSDQVLPPPHDNLLSSTIGHGGARPVATHHWLDPGAHVILATTHRARQTSPRPSPDS